MLLDYGMYVAVLPNYTIFYRNANLNRFIFKKKQEKPRKSILVVICVHSGHNTREECSKCFFS